MKFNPFLRNTRYLILFSIILFSLNACGQNKTGVPVTTNKEPASSEMITINSEQPSDRMEFL